MFQTLPIRHVSEEQYATDDPASVPLDRSGATFDWSLYAIPTDQYFVIRPTNDAGSSNRTERSVVDRLATMFMEELKNFVQGTPRSFALGPAC